MITVITTAPEDTAPEIAETLVEERLAACVNTHPINSIYRWEGEIVTDNEVALDIKTARPYSEVRDRVQELHPYDVPAIIRIDAEANPRYEEWVRESTR